EHYQRRAKSPETAHDVQGQHWPKIEPDLDWIGLREHAAIQKEESQRHNHAEKEKHFVAQGELHARPCQRAQIAQSRNLLPVSSIKTSSRDGVAISRPTSSLLCDSRYFTSETIACGGRRQCRT